MIWTPRNQIALPRGQRGFFTMPGGMGASVAPDAGALVKIGHTLAAALRGGALRDVIAPLMLWGGLTAGAILGALAFSMGGLVALYPAAGLAAALAVAAGRVRAT